MRHSHLLYLNILISVSLMFVYFIACCFGIYEISLKFNDPEWNHLLTKWVIDDKRSDVGKYCTKPNGSNEFVFRTHEEEINIPVICKGFFRTYLGEVNVRYVPSSNGIIVHGFYWKKGIENKYEMVWDAKVVEQKDLKLSALTKFYVNKKDYVEEFQQRSFLRHNKMKITNLDKDNIEVLGKDVTFLTFLNKISQLTDFLSDDSWLTNIFGVLKTLRRVSRFYNHELLETTSWRESYESIKYNLSVMNELVYAKYASAAYSTNKCGEKHIDILQERETYPEVIKSIMKKCGCKENDILIAKSSGDKNISFVLIKKSEEELVLAFKGTGTLDEATNDIDLFYSRFNGTSLKSSSGFIIYAANFLTKEHQWIEHYMRYFKKLTITGHSLGGAIASLYNAAIHQEKYFVGKRIKCVTFSSAPSVSDEFKYLPHITNQMNFIYETDVVPQAQYGSALLLKYIMQQVVRYKVKDVKDIQRIVEKCRKVKTCEKWDEKVCHLVSPGKLYHVIYDKACGYRCKQIEQNNLEEIKLTYASIGHHSMSHFVGMVQ